MASNLGSLVVSIGLDDATFTRGLSRVAAEVDRAASNMDAAFASFAGNLAANFAANVIGTLAALPGQALAAVSAFQDIGDQIGATAESVSGLQRASAASGTAMENIAGASVKLTAALAKAGDEGGDVAKALAAINVPFDEFKTLDPVGQLQAVATAMAQFETSADKTAVAVSLFGKSGAELIPFLNDLADLGSSPIFSAEQIAAADEFGRTLDIMAGQAATLGQRFVIDVLPPLQEILNAARQGGDDFSILSTAAGALRVVFETIAVVAANVIFVFKAVGREIAAIAAQIAALATLDINGFHAISDAVREDAQRARRELDAFENRMLNSQIFAANAKLQSDPRELARRGRPVAAAPTIDASGLAKPEKEKKTRTAKTVDEAARYLENMQRQVRAAQDLSNEERALQEIQSGRLGKVTQAQQAAIVGAAQQLDSIKATADMLKAQVQQENDLRAARAAEQEEAKRLYEETRTPIEKLNAEQARLQDLLDRGVIDWDTYGRAVMKASEAYDEIVAKSEKTKEEMDSFAKTAAENIQGYLGDTFADAMEGNFENIGDSFVKMINRMVAEALAADLARAMFGSDAKGGSGSGWVGTLASLAGSFFGGGKAGGGPVMPGMMYEVSENRPETLDVGGRKYLMMGNQRGNIDPNPRFGGGGQQINNITVQVPESTNRHTGTQIAADIQRKLSVGGRNS